MFDYSTTILPQRVSLNVPKTNILYIRRRRAGEETNFDLRSLGKIQPSSVITTLTPANENTGNKRTNR